MTDLDQGILRPWLDEYERYARAIAATDPRFGIAQEMLGIIASARESWHPSTDSTANFVENREIISLLATLREKSDKLNGTDPEMVMAKADPERDLVDTGRRSAYGLSDGSPTPRADSPGPRQHGK